jgi:hypothetical protein
MKSLTRRGCRIWNRVEKAYLSRSPESSAEEAPEICAKEAPKRRRELFDGGGVFLVRVSRE